MRKPEYRALRVCWPMCDMRRHIAVVIAGIFCMTLVTAVNAKQPWPQYTNVAPLPGSGIALNSEGYLDGNGALQINVPVAYTPHWGFANFSAYNGKYSMGIDEGSGNGSGILGMGFGNRPRFYGSGMQVSRDWNEAKAVSGQLMLFEEKQNTPAVSVGIQDALMKEKHMRALYVVGTKKFTTATNRAIYATLGYGGGRFLDRPFAGVSTPVGQSLNLAAEWDGFQVNTGLAWRPGGRNGKITALGAYNGKAGWLFGVGTAIDIYSPIK